MRSLAPLLEGFFVDRLMRQRRASPHTIAAYRDTFRMFIRFVQKRLKKSPSSLDLQDLDASLIGAFLDHLEKDRQNGERTRNARLSAIRSFFHYAAFQAPEHSGLIQRVLAIPQKRFERKVVHYLTAPEVEALLAAPDRGTWIGRRDHAILVTAIQTGLRVSELIQLSGRDVELGVGAHVRCLGKGRKERCTPLTAQTVQVLSSWLREQERGPADPIFPGRRGSPLSRDAIERLVTKHAARAAVASPSLRSKRVTPHTLRHTAAMRLLGAGIDQSMIALLLGHESVETTQVYLHADSTMKEAALAKTAPLSTPPPGRYRPPDALMAFLTGL
jgi:site-specific recombinase XerD